MASTATGVQDGGNVRHAVLPESLLKQDAPTLPAVALGIVLLLQIGLIFSRAINWDEYSFYREVAQFSDGYLARPLQTIHVRFFTWLPGLFETSTDHIVAGRVAMFVCELVTIACIIATGRHFSGTSAAVIAALAYVSAGFVFQHGTSFRIDPIVTALLALSLTILATARLKTVSILVFGLLLGLAGMVSIKAILYLPAFAGIAIGRWYTSGWSRSEFLRLALCVLCSAAFFAAIYVLHGRDVTANTGTSGSAQLVVNTAFDWAFFVGIPPYWHHAVKAALTAPLLTAMIVALPVVLRKSDIEAPRKIALIGLWLPICSLFFYTNTAAYFYVFLLPPMVIACTPVIAFLIQRYSTSLLALIFLATTCVIWLQEESSIIERQRQVERNVHEVFASPVPYFDHNYMLGEWPKMNGFLTPQGLYSYRQTGTLAYRDAMESHEIPLFLANHPMLEDVMLGRNDELFFSGDLAALRGNYIELSWPIWIAGKDFAGRAGRFTEEFLVPGPYTVHGGDLVVDGLSYADGSLLEIERGEHEVMVIDNQPVKLMWGDHLGAPAQPVEPGDLYVDF